MTQNVISAYSSLLFQEFDKNIIIQLLQSASILIHNINSEDSGNYLLKSQFFKEILAFPLDFADSEVVDNYMSLLKGLSVNLTHSQLRDYVLENNYTLFTGAMIFFNHSDHIVKTTSRSVVLRILTSKFYLVNDEEINGFILASGFFINLVNHLKESIVDISRSIASSKSLSKLEQVISDTTILLEEFRDIFDLENNKINENIKDALMKMLILPILASSIIEEKPKAYHLPMPIAINAFGHLLRGLQYIPLRQEIIKVLFSERLPKIYYELMISPPSKNSGFLINSDELVPNKVQLFVSGFLKCSEDNLLGLGLSILQGIFLIDAEGTLPASDVTFDEMIDKLLFVLHKISVAEEEYRFFTHFLTVNIVYQLHCCNYLKGKTEELLSIVGRALEQRSKNALGLIQNSHNPVDLIQVFRDELKFVLDQTWDQYFTLPLNYILASIDQSSEIPLELRRSTSESDYSRTEIRLLLLYKQLRHLIFPTTQTGLSSNLSQLETCSLELGEFYDVDSEVLKGKSITKVTEKGITGHIRYVIDDKKFLVLASLHSDLDCYLVETCFRFSKISLQDMPEPNVIMLKTHEGKNLLLVFEEPERWLMLKNKLEKRIRECREFDVEVLKQFVVE